MAILPVAATKLTGAGTTASGAVSATAGNAIICGGAGFNGTAWTVSRTGDTFTTDDSGTTSGGVNGQIIGVASASNVTGGSATLTASATSAIGTIAYAFEVSGAAKVGLRDALSPAILTGTGTAGSTNSLTNTTAGAIFVAVVGSESGANPSTVTPGSGWTDTVGGTTMKETNGASNPVNGMEFKIVSVTAATSASWTLSSAAWGGIIAVYKIAPPDDSYVPPPVFPGVFNLDVRRMFE